jgi:hypothetical protein
MLNNPYLKKQKPQRKEIDPSSGPWSQFRDHGYRPKTNPSMPQMAQNVQNRQAATTTNSYNKKNYQPGWGIGYADDNISNNFGEWYNPQALQTEIERVNTVMGNRKDNDLSNDAYTTYLDKLNKHNQPYAEVDPNKFRSESATIDDLAKKYGFDYSREYAKRQAEAEAQARRNANADAQRRNESNSKVGKQEIDNNLMGMAESLDRNYFQEYMAQQQNQVGEGLNSGIAADQNLRLAMSRQANMGDAYRDANLGKMKINEEFSLNDIRLAEELGLIDQQSLAREDSLYNDRLNQAFGQVMDLNNLNLQYDQMGLDAALQQRSENLDYNQFDRNLSQQKREFEFDKEQFRWDKLLDESALTGMFNGKQTTAERQRNWENLWKQTQFGNLSAYEQAQLSQSQNQFNAQLGWDQSRFNTEFNNLSASQQMEYEMRMRELQQALSAGDSYSDLSPELKAFIDSGGKIQGHSVAGIGFKNGSLGSLSAKYESSGDIGTIANNQGDWGGKSYGKYQIATNTGTMKGFISWLKQADSSFYQALARNSAGSSGFDSTWKSLAKNYPEKFEQLQHGFIKSTHYDPVVTSLANGIGLNVNKRSGALQNVIWSLGVQHGAGGASNLVKAAGVKPGMNDRQIIDAIYRERSKVDKYFSRSSSNIKKSVYNRFQREWKDAISMLG